MSILADLLATVWDRRYLGAGERDSRPLPQLAADLLSARGEVSGMGLARQILDRYAEMDDAGRAEFFALLATGMDIDPDAVRATLSAYEADPSQSAYRAFAQASEPPRQELFRRLNQVPGATGRLVAMRADLHRLGRNDRLAAVDLDLRHLFASWFNRGFLVLRPISWESPAAILEKIIEYEAVHAIDDWDDLRRRVQPADRRCFAFFHPAMPDEPLIFVEVALTRGVPGSVQGLLAEDRRRLDAAQADTAVFYSISNCQSGLAGISFGNSLIKQVVEDLSRELPNLRTFVTLSPIPGLARWMEKAGHQAADDEALRRLAALYLTEARRPDGAPLDPVARFHLGNGALVHAVHAGADTSPNGMAQSHGAMVNYVYDLDRITPNAQAFADSHQIAAAAPVRTLARQAARTEKKKEPEHGQPSP